MKLTLSRGLVALLGSALLAPSLHAAVGKADLVGRDYAEERVVDLSIVKKVTGRRKILFIKTPKYTEYLEGFIRGMVVDYSDNPVEGVLVRVGDPGEENSMFDPTVTKRLYAAGQPLGQAGPAGWNHGPPRLDADPIDPNDK